MTTPGYGRRSNFGSFIVDGRGTILGFDLAMERLTEWPAIEVVGRSKELSTSSGPGEIGRTVSLFEGSLQTSEGNPQREITLRCRDGRQLQVEASVTGLPGTGARLLVTVLRVMARSGQLMGQRNHGGVGDRFCCGLLPAAEHRCRS